MSSYDDLDREIDQEMGWDRGEPGAGKKGASIRRSPGYWEAIMRTARASSPLWRAFRSVVRAICKVVFFPIISPMGYSKRFDVHGDMMVVKRSLFWRIADGLLTRLLLTPVILGVFLMGVVYAATHPRTVQALNTPDSMGLYFKRISLFTVDNQRISAWFIPPLNAEEVAFDLEGMLIQKWPAAVLVHGLGDTHDQYLSLARRLHTEGFAVLMIDMRGQGESASAAVTYGLRERMDILAGVKMLRETTYVDPSKVSVVGRNIGATAALQAATLDSSITSIVADGLWNKFEDRARDIFTHPNPGSPTEGTLPTQWLAPLYSIAFEIAVRDRLSQLDPEAAVRNIHTQPVLFIAREGPDCAPVQDVLTLATSAGSHHDVILADGNWEKKVVDFLVKSSNWKGPKARGTQQIENLLKNSVSSPSIGK